MKTTNKKATNSFLRQYFTGDECWANVFDTCLVGMLLVEQIADLTKLRDVRDLGTTFSILRLFRIIRIVRLLRVLRLVGDLNDILAAITSSLSALGWVMALLAMLLYMFSVVFTQLFFTYGDKDSDEYQQLFHFMGTVPRTALTLFETIFGGLSWDEPVRLINQVISPAAVVVYCVYVALYMVAIMNIITGVFIDKSLRAAKEADEHRICHNVASLFFDSDDPQKQISWEIFESKLCDADMDTYLKEIDISPAEAKNLFELLDTDNSGGVDCSELVNGLLRLKGPAGSLELSLVLRELNYLVDRFEHRLSTTGLVGEDI